jgi:hypothetical protein
MVSNCQSAFIKKRSIHDNFLYVQSTIREMHKHKTHALFMKLDIHKDIFKAFKDACTLPLRALGFGQRWHEWVSILFHTATSSVLINGRPGPKLFHTRGVRQGDPLSPLQFILAMDPLQRILDLATNHGTLSPLPEETARWRTLLYADAAAILLNPVRQDMQAVVEILQAFGHFSGLRINLEKSSIHPIRCEDIELDHVLEPFNGIRESFPCRYLGLQLHTCGGQISTGSTKRIKDLTKGPRAP